MALTTNQLIVGMFNAAAGGFKTDITTYIANMGANGVDSAAGVLLSQSPLGATFLGQSLYNTNASFSAAVVSSLLPGLSTSTMASVNSAVTGFWTLNPALTRSQLVVKLIEAVVAIPATDALLGAAAGSFKAKVALADAYTGTSTDLAVLSTVIGATPAAVTTFSLTTGVDNLVGSSGDDTFSATIKDNANTAQSGDKIDGGAGNDYLSMDIGNSQKFAITLETTGVESVAIRAQAVAVDSNNNNMQDVPVVGATALSYANAVQIDAQRMVGVTTWESNNSRADVVIEDVRILPSQITKDITIAMVETDPGHVDMGVYFDQLSLRSNSNNTSTLNLRVIDTYAVSQGLAPLKDSPYGSFTFTATQNGVATVVTLASKAMQDAQTYPELAAAVQSALDAKFGAGAATATVGADFTRIDSVSSKSVVGQTIVITAKAAIAFTTPDGSGWLANDTVPAISGLHTSYDTLSASNTDLVTAKIILDDVGRGSTSGDLVVGGLSVGDTSTSQGVQRFEIEVRDNSKLESINSTNNTLREVVIKNGATSSSSSAYQTTVTNAGNLTVNGNSGTNGGNVTNTKAVDAFVGENLPLPGAVAQITGGFGFSDVRVIDASAMTGKLALSAEVTAASIGKYANLQDVAASPSADNVAFTYTGGANDDTLFVRLDSTAVSSRSTFTSGREDFTFAVNAGAGNDVINVGVTNGASTLAGGAQAWYTNQKLNANVTVNGGEGNDTITTPGAGDKIINGDGGNDTIYADNTGVQGAAVASSNASLAATAYANASAAELAGAIAVATLADATNAGTTAAAAAALNVLNLVTPVAFPAATAPISHATMAAATAAAAAAGAITLAQQIALDLAYNSATGGTVTTPATLVSPAITGATPVAGNLTAAEFAAGNAALDAIIATAKAAAAQALAADFNTATRDTLLNGTQLAVENATIAMNGVAGTSTKVANLNALSAALTVGATDEQVVAALQTAVNNGAITPAQSTAMFGAVVATVGTIDATELANVQLQLTPLQNAAANANATAAAALNAAVTANNAAMNAAANAASADPVFAPTSNVVNDAVGSVESAAAASAATSAFAAYNTTTLNPTAARGADLAGLKSAITIGTTDLAVTTATANALAKGSITAADATAINAAAGATVPTVGGTVVATEKTAVDLLVTALQLVNEADLAAKQLISADLAATVALTATASTVAQAAANSGSATNAMAPSKGVFVLNTANQAAVGTGYNLTTNDERNLSDLKSGTNDAYNMFGTKLTVNFKGIEKAVDVASTGYKTTDLQINQAIKDAIVNDAVLSKLLMVTDGPANTLVVTSMIDGVLTTADLKVTVALPATGGIAFNDIAPAATAYGFVGTATEANVLGLMAISKATFDTRGDYTAQFAESGAAAGNTSITGARSVTSSDNTINGGTGNDVIVLGTTLSVDALTSSNDTVVFGAGFGSDTIVNFAATGNGYDVLNFSALGGSGAAAFTNSAAASFNDVSLVNKSISIIDLDTSTTSTNDTAAKVGAFFNAAATAATPSTTHVVLVANAVTNIASIYSVTDTVAADAVATLQGTLDMADTAYASLTAANFTAFAAPVTTAPVVPGTVTVPGGVATGAPVTVIVPVVVTTPTYSVSAAATAAEGTSATFTVNTTNVANGTALAYTLSGVGITAADVTGGALTGLVTITGNTGTITVPLAADLTTEGNETLTATVMTASASTTVTDTSLTPVIVGGPVAVAAAGSVSAAGGDFTYNVASGNYTYTIANFAALDKIAFFSGAVLAIVPDANDTDGLQSYTATDPGTAAVVTIALTGLTNAQDLGLFNVPSFNTVFGAGSMA